MSVYIITELGKEKRCSGCNEYYPFDEEFFYKNGYKDYKQQWSALCRACYVEKYRNK